MRRGTGFACRLVVFLAGTTWLSLSAAAQDLAPPAPQRLVVHSDVLKEDRIIWVRTPRAYDHDKVVYPVVYLMDGPGHINEIGSTIDFLAEQNRIPELIVVGIANTDRTRDLTPTHWDVKRPEGTVNANPTSGGGDHFLDFIQKELMPQIEKRYRTSCYRVFAGHSLGGLMVIHTLITRPDLFQAYIAVSPSLQWNDQGTLHDAQRFFAGRAELKKALFFSLGNEGNTPNPMGDGFDQLRKTLTAKAPKEFHWGSERYPDETHGSTVLLAHYAGLRTVFYDWQMPVNAVDGGPEGGMAGLEKHYRGLSERFCTTVRPPEALVNQLGYQLMGQKKLDEAISAFQRNVELYPDSANVYDSLGEGYENAGKLDLAIQYTEKAITIGGQISDPNLDAYKAHLKRVQDAKAATK